MIVRDNARTIVPCLESIRPWVDEMIVVDTGSVDDTPAICRSLGARVYSFPWIDDFSAARNESLKYARSQWLFWMDSDDTIPAACGRKLRELVLGSHGQSVLGYVMQVHCPGPAEADGDEMTIVDHVKLIRNLPQVRFEGRIHEQVIPSIRRLEGEIDWTDIYVVHSGSGAGPAARHAKYERDLRILKLDLAERPDHPFVLFNLGMTYSDMEQHEEAVTWLRRSLAVSHEGESHLRKVYALLVGSLTQLKRLGEAQQVSHEARLRFPKDPELRFREGNLAHAQGRLPDAVAAYRAALRNDDLRHFSSIDPCIVGYKARHNLALVYEDLGRHDQAELQWRLVTELAPRFRAAWRAIHDILTKRQLETTALVQRERMLAQSATRADGHVASARHAERVGDLQQARDDFASALRERHDDPAILEAWCRFLYDHGTLIEAEQALRRLLEASPGTAAAWHNLGVVLLRQGKLSPAAGALETSLALRPADDATRADFALVQLMTSKASEQLPSTGGQVSNMTANAEATSADEFGLEPCHSRREFDRQEQRFFCAHPKVGIADALVSPEFCRVCSLWKQAPPSRFRMRPESQARQRRSVPCQHLGDQIGLQDCPTCRGQVQIKVFVCSHPAHIETTRDQCLQCRDYLALDEPAQATAKPHKDEVPSHCKYQLET
jgi:tetratricopeptide (TPR) repeat protein